jgi:sigma-E factor negative regulatory protein RseA
MTEQFQEQVSTFVDDELSMDECEFFVRRIQRDDESRSRLVRYHMIGAVLRGEIEHGQADAYLLRRRLARALGGSAPVREANPPQRRALATFARPLAGAAVAAGVAIAAVLALQLTNRESPGVGTIETLQANEQSAPAAYVVPRDAPARRLVSPPIRLTNYLMHHGEYTSNLSRTSVHSNVVAAGQPDVTQQNEEIEP